jgi:lysozyme family protein
MTFDDIITGILAREGGDTYTNVPGDSGGPTKYGITLKTLQAWRGNKFTTSDDVKNLTEHEARSIYMQSYIVGPGYASITNPSLVEELIDSGVQHGVTTTIRMLQRAVKVNDDGKLGPQTLAVVNSMSKSKAVVLFLGQRAHYYAKCLSQPHNLKFAAGWFNRLGTMIEQYGREL